MKVTRTIYIDNEIWDQAGGIYGERGRSSAIEQFLQEVINSKQNLAYKCKCGAQFFASVWTRHPEMRGYCPECHLGRDDLIVIL